MVDSWVAFLIIGMVAQRRLISFTLGKELTKLGVCHFEKLSELARCRCLGGL